jgi:hypothetical protein
MFLAARDGYLTSWIAWAALAFGLWGVIGGILFRLGRLRRMARWYHRRDLPFYVRNLPFPLIPWGLMFLASVALFALADAGLARAAIVVVYVWVGLFLVGLWFDIRPPLWLKPEWLRLEEEPRKPDSS